MENQPHVAVFPGPVMGHLIPFIELAKKLANHHNFHVTCIVPSVGPPPAAMKEAIQALPPTINHVFLPPPSLEDLPKETKPMTIISLSMIRSLPFLRDLLKSLQTTTRLVAFILNPAATDAYHVGKELNIPSYLFFTSNATALSSILYFQNLNGEAIPDVVHMPGCVPFNKRDLVEGVEDPNDEAYEWTMHMSRKINLGQGILVNTFQELEPGPIKALEKSNVYPIGPLVRLESSGIENKTNFLEDRISFRDDRPDCLKWLDDQLCASVLFVSFGSAGTLSDTQLSELALGLEMSGQRFLWVARSPNNESASGAAFTMQSEKNPFEFLPKGFLDNTKGRGLVVASWAPQDQVLSHVATGGFLSHCGWNSTLESVVNGVPLIAWPLYAEQKMNAVMLSEDIKVALRPKMNKDGVVVKEEVAMVVKELMEGEEGSQIREKMKKLKEAALKVMGDEGSYVLSELAHQWKNHQV